MDVLENSRKSHQKEVEKLNEIHNRESEERKRILEEYNKNIDILKKEYADKDRELDSEKKKEIKKLVEEGYNDPEKLSRELAKLYGLEYG
jgi:predicted secreted protein